MIEDISGLDDLFHDVTLTDQSTGAALTTGTVSMVFCKVGTATPLSGTSSQALAHVAAGRWTAIHDAADVADAIADLAIGAQFDRVVIVDGGAKRTLARCRRVAIVNQAT